jgi:hypothetical protein
MKLPTKLEIIRGQQVNIPNILIRMFLVTLLMFLWIRKTNFSLTGHVFFVAIVHVHDFEHKYKHQHERQYEHEHRLRHGHGYAA